MSDSGDDADTHRGAAAPHTGHETPAGAQTKADGARDEAIAHADGLGPTDVGADPAGTAAQALTDANTYTDAAIDGIDGIDGGQL